MFACLSSAIGKLASDRLNPIYDFIEMKWFNFLRTFNLQEFNELILY